jgi:hypothetical protein
MFRALLITGVVLLAGNAGMAQACGHRARCYTEYYTSCCATPVCCTPVVYTTAPVVQYTSSNVVVATPATVECCAPVVTYYTPCYRTVNCCYPTYTYYSCWGGRRWR